VRQKQHRHGNEHAAAEDGLQHDAPPRRDGVPVHLPGLVRDGRAVPQFLLPAEGDVGAPRRGDGYVRDEGRGQALSMGTVLEALPSPTARPQLAATARQ
jgi:hypothetical protein